MAPICYLFPKWVHTTSSTEQVGTHVTSSTRPSSPFGETLCRPRGQMTTTSPGLGDRVSPSTRLPPCLHSTEISTSLC